MLHYENLDCSHITPEEQIKLLASLLKNGIVYVNTWSQDCDGVEGYYTNEYTSVEDYTNAKAGWVDSLEGPAGWEIVSKQNKYKPHETGSFGYGWDIN